MLRFIVVFLVAVAASGTAMSAEQPVAPQGFHNRVHRTAVILPAGLPRPHYKFRTTISYGPTYSYRRTHDRRFYSYESDVLFTPAYADVPYIPPLIGTPLLPGSSTLPGYYRSAFYSYDYQGPYYAGPYVNYWDRLPYACGVYGYC